MAQDCVGKKNQMAVTAVVTADGVEGKELVVAWLFVIKDASDSCKCFIHTLISAPHNLTP